MTYHTKYINVLCACVNMLELLYDKQVMGMGRRMIVRIKYFYNTESNIINVRFFKVLKRKQDTMYFYKHTLYVTIYTVRTSNLYIELYMRS